MQSNLIHRMLSFTLALLVCISLAACAGEGAPSSVTTAEPSLTTAEPDNAGSRASDETTAAIPEVTDDLPANLRFDKQTVSFLVRNGLKNEFIAEEVTGEVVNDAILARNRSVEERLGVTLEFFPLQASWSDYNAEVRRAVQGNTGEYDVVTNYAYYGAALATEGLYLNLHELPYLNLEQPWWNQSFARDMTVSGGLYFVVGDMTLSAFDRAMVTFFNKTLVESHFGQLDLYAVVKEGKWTLDYLGELVKDSYGDLDGDSQNDLEDFHGVSFNLGSMCLDGMQTALGIDVAVRDADDKPTISLNNEHFINAYSKLYDFIYKNTGVGYNPTTTTGYYGTMGNTYYASQKLFNRQCIFAFDILSDTGILRNFDDPYGVLPLPKYDEAQEQYRTTPQDAYSLVSVPTTVENPEMIGAVLEAMGAESYRQLRPAYFEKTYKYKYLDSPDDAEMFDLVIDTITYNFGVVNSSALGDPAWTFRKQLMAGTETIASMLKTYDKMYTKKMDTVLEKYAELGK